MKIFCIGRNYVDHAKELNNKVPTKPLVFMKPITALCTGQNVKYPALSKNVHYELELVLSICKEGFNIPLEEANSYFDKIGLGIDYTARDVQAACKEKGHPWEIAKGYDNSATLSPFFPKENYDLSNIKFELTKNEIIVQKGETKDLIFPFDYLIHYLSQIFTLEVGDVIYTGTPAGVGPVQPGDRLIGYLEGQAVLDNTIV